MLHHHDLGRPFGIHECSTTTTAVFKHTHSHTHAHTLAIARVRLVLTHLLSSNCNARRSSLTAVGTSSNCRADTANSEQVRGHVSIPRRQQAAAAAAAAGRQDALACFWASSIRCGETPELSYSRPHELLALPACSVRNATNAKRVSARGSKSTSYRTTRSSVAYCACGTSLLLLLLLLLALLLEDALLALERLLLTQELLLLAAQ